MKVIKIIKKFLGLDLPYLLEDEEEKLIEFKAINNIVSIPKNTEFQFYKNRDWEDIRLLSKTMLLSGMTMNEAREIAAKMGGFKNECTKDYKQK